MTEDKKKPNDRRGRRENLTTDGEKHRKAGKTSSEDRYQLRTNPEDEDSNETFKKRGVSVVGHA